MANTGVPPLEISEFDGGITDDYLDCPANAYQTADNLLVKFNKKFETRPGSRIYDDTMYQIPAGATRVAAQVLFDDVYFFYNNRNLYYQSGSWQTLTGPSSNPTFAAGATTAFLSWAEWNKHLIVTNDSFGSPMKVYKDSNGTVRVRNAGLPKVTLTACIELANQLKSKYNTHAASAVRHTTGADLTNVITSDDAYDFPSLVTLVNELTTDYVAHNADANLASGRSYHPAQQVGAPITLTSTANVETLLECKTQLDDLKSKYNTHEADTTAHAGVSSQQVTKYSQPQLSSAGGSGSNFIYTFVPYYEYTVGSTTFRDYGPTHQVTITNVGAPNTNTITISQIPTIANGSTENFDTSVIKWQIYRTEANGTTSYYVKSVTNGTTSTTDTLADASLILNSQIYTAGGVLDNDPPPQAKFVVQANDIVWYGYVKEGGNIRKSRIRQSVKFDPDSCPESFYLDLDDELTGMGAVGIYPIAFCKKRIYRIEGFKDDQGRGTIEKREISRTIGSVNQNSIINTLDGVYFAGTDGFYFTDGYKVIRVSSQFPTSYARLVSSATQRGRINAAYDIAKNRIYWTVSQTSSSTDNDRMYVLHLNFPLSDRSCFTTVTPGDDTWQCSSIGFDASGNFVIGDSRGYVFKFDENKFSDPKIDTGANPSAWIESALIWDHRGPAFSFGTKNLKKWVTWITATLENQTNMSIQIRGKNDDSGSFQDLKQIRFRENIVWEDPDAPAWGVSGFPWEYFPLVTEKRRFPRQNVRCLFKQIQFTNALTNIINSDVYGEATTNVITDTVALNNYPTQEWPTDCVDYFISFEDDDYTRNYLITARTAQTLTFLDTLSTAPSGSQKWVIRGIRRNERLNLVAYTLEWQPLSSSHGVYRGDDGSVAE